MKITLCYPALLPGHKSKYGLQPLGVLYIAALLKREGFEVEVLDADIDGLSVQETVDRVLATKPDLVGFSMMTPQLITALACCTLLKERRPEIPIVLGGAHFDSTKGDTFEMANCFDFAVHGEGEWTLLEACQALRDHGEFTPEGVTNLQECIEAVREWSTAIGTLSKCRRTRRGPSSRISMSFRPSTTTWSTSRNTASRRWPAVMSCR